MKNYLRLIDFSKVFTSQSNTKYRYVTLYDNYSKKETEHIIWETRDNGMWECILDGTYKNSIFKGKIITIKLTKELVDDANINNYYIRFIEGQELDIVWFEIDWYDTTEEDILKSYLREQLWRIKVYPNQEKTWLERQNKVK